MYNQNLKKLGELLIEAGLITTGQLQKVLSLQQNTGKKLGEIIIEENFAKEQDIVEALELQLGIPYIDFENMSIDASVPRLISESIARKHTLIPVLREGDVLTVAMTDPLDLFAIDDVKLFSGLEIKTAIAFKAGIQMAIERYYGKEGAEKAVEDFRKQNNFDQITESDAELSEVSNAPVVRLVNSVIQHAMKLKASDIHIEPLLNSLRIRFRIDGELQEIMKSSKSAHPAVVTRIKIMGRMDIAEKRLPQDGRVEMNVDGQDIDLRLSVIPSVYGEKVVIRILGRSDTMLTKSQLGFNNDNIALFDRIIKSPNGIILVTGPTGSGKTTTLYAILRELNKINRNIITVEDPVEYKIEGITQLQVNTKAGLTFANGLRSILRQDPDVIMVGEIRDAETAQIAVRAAITGHLVLSTVHTNDCASTVSRLADMGIEPYLISSSIIGIISQRLVKKICTNCKKAYIPDAGELSLLKLKENQPLYKGMGCSNCNGTGYKGRTSIHEIMLVNKDIRELIDKRATIDEINVRAAEQGTLTLRDSCTELVLNGTTTTEELIRTTYSLD